MTYRSYELLPIIIQVPMPEPSSMKSELASPRSSALLKGSGNANYLNLQIAIVYSSLPAYSWASKFVLPWA